MDAKLHATYETVSEHMDAILGCFKPGCKITVLVRTPGYPDRDFMLTSDDPKEAIALIERRVAA